MLAIVEPDETVHRLTTWFRRHARPLPWRTSHDPYHVLVAEFILQQTRIETGLRYWSRFVERFPTLEALANAPEPEVLRLWSGLGYYSRARNLHRTARRIVHEFDGRIPQDPDVLETLPGIGPYTAGAIASIAYDRPVPSIDGNQARVLGRFLGVQNADSTGGRKRVVASVQGLLAAGSPRVLNQALMDIGSTLCLPRVPRCGECPLASACRTRSRFQPARRRGERPTPTEDWDVQVFRRGESLWLQPALGQGLLAGLWLPPIRRAARPVQKPDLVHAFSHRRWRIRCAPGKGRPPRPGRWIRAADLEGVPHSRLTTKVFDWAANGSPVNHHVSMAAPSGGSKTKVPPASQKR